MAVEQLTLLDLSNAVRAEALTRPRARRTIPPSVPTAASALAVGKALIEHRYPEALAFLRAHGPDAVAVLHVLAADAEMVDGCLVVRASTRGVAGQLGFLSKDSAHRRLRELCRAGVLEALPATGPMDPPSYVIHLDGTGITVTHPLADGRPRR